MKITRKLPWKMERRDRRSVFCPLRTPSGPGVSEMNGAYIRSEDRDAFAPKARSVPARGKSAGSGATAARRPGKPTETVEPLCKSGSKRPKSNPCQTYTLVS